MKITPIYDNILLEPLEIKSSGSGILLPNTIQDKPCFGTVIACPNSTEEINIVVEKNDIVIFNKFSGTEFKLDNKTYIIVKQKDILAILN